MGRVLFSGAGEYMGRQFSDSLEAIMQQWEYLFVTCDYQEGDWRPRYVNGAEVREAKAWSEMTLYEFSNLLGEKGWGRAA